MANELDLKFGLLKLLIIYFYVWFNISFPSELILDLQVIKHFLCSRVK